MRARAVVFATRHTDSYAAKSRGWPALHRPCVLSLRGFQTSAADMLARRTARAWRAESVLTPQKCDGAKACCTSAMGR